MRDLVKATAADDGQVREFDRRIKGSVIVNALNVCWREGGRRRTRCFADFSEAELIAQQISVRLANRLATGKEATHRDIEILQHRKDLVRPFNIARVAAEEEWATARRSAPTVAPASKRFVKRWNVSP